MNVWGRVFFDYKGDRLASVKGQPLENHTDNCLEILGNFRDEWFHPSTKKLLLRAVRLHDEGKKQTFRIRTAKEGPKRNSDKAPAELTYSFSGHRFHVPEDDPYVVGLIRSHHEFSVEQVNREKARLRGSQKETFPDDLYLLCMSDHLEAELAMKSVVNSASSPRTFMEFATAELNGEPGVFKVFPWPFENDELSLSFNLKDLPLEDLQDHTSQSIQNALLTSRFFREETVAITLRR